LFLDQNNGVTLASVTAMNVTSRRRLIVLLKCIDMVLLFLSLSLYIYIFTVLLLSFFWGGVLSNTKFMQSYVCVNIDAVSLDGENEFCVACVIGFAP